MRRFKWRVREVAMKQGLTSMLLADRAGINKNTATALWHGRPTRVDLPTLERICNALQCRVEDILELVDERLMPTRVPRSIVRPRRQAESAVV